MSSANVTAPPAPSPVENGEPDATTAIAPGNDPAAGAGVAPGKGIASSTPPAPYSAPTTVPPHTQTQSNLAPTAEFTRIFLLAWIIRYVFRGFSGAAFADKLENKGVRGTILNSISMIGRGINKMFKGSTMPELEAATYSGLIGLGSGWLSLRYGQMVKHDIVNIFREAVALEKNIPQEQVTYRDIENSDNTIVQRTVQNYRSKMWERLGTDALFFLAAPLRSTHVVDGLLGVKGVQIFADTWKRKTTMFEDLVTFITNKINPRNGLGQPIAVGEVFDLYQHYAEGYHPEKMFQTVVTTNPAETARWAQSQPVFQRITELLNQSYAYKHIASTTEPPRANFALPVFVYLMGHDLIDADQPQRTLTAIELANRDGIPAVKQMEAMLKSGASLEQVQAHYKIKLPELGAAKPNDSEKNGVIAKGSTMQLDAVPQTSIDASTAAAQGATSALQALPAL